MYLGCGVGLSWKSFRGEGQIIASAMGSEFGSDCWAGASSILEDRSCVRFEGGHDCGQIGRGRGQNEEWI